MVNGPPSCVLALQGPRQHRCRATQCSWSVKGYLRGECYRRKLTWSLVPACGCVLAPQGPRQQRCRALKKEPPDLAPWEASWMTRLVALQNSLRARRALQRVC